MASIWILNVFKSQLYLVQRFQTKDVLVGMTGSDLKFRLDLFDGCRTDD